MKDHHTVSSKSAFYKIFFFILLLCATHGHVAAQHKVTWTNLPPSTDTPAEAPPKPAESSPPDKPATAATPAKPATQTAPSKSASKEPAPPKPAVTPAQTPTPSAQPSASIPEPIKNTTIVTPSVSSSKQSYIWQKAQAFTADEQIDSAIRYWSIYSAQHPDDDSVLAQLAMLYYKNGNTDSAAVTIHRAIALHHKHTPYLTLSAIIDYQTHHLESALLTYKEILADDANNANALLFSGIILRDQSQHQQAFEYFDKCVKADPSNTEALLYRAEAFVFQKKYNEALKDYTAARADLSANADILNNIGICHQELGNYQAAISYFKKAILSNKNHPQSYFNRGISYYQLHDLDTATIDIKTAIAIWDSCHTDSACRASFLDAVYYLAICSKQTGDVDNAKKYFELLQKSGYKKDLSGDLKYIDYSIFISANWYYILILLLLAIALLIVAIKMMRR